MMVKFQNPMLRALEGERYEVQAPDTLDLADRMALAVNALTNVFNPSEKYALYFTVRFSCRPPLLMANHPMDAFLNIPPKFIEALALCRLASGTDLNIQTDGAVLAEQLALVAEDGLSYTPLDAMVRLEHPEMERPFAETWAEGRTLIALSMLTQLDDNPIWAEVARRKVDAMLSLATEKDDYLYLWKMRLRPGDRPNGAPEPGLWPAIYASGALGHGSALFHRVTGYEPALKLARGLARWAAKRVFCSEDGSWNYQHFHHSLYSLIGVLEYALAAGDEELLARVDACYRFAREMGDSLIGYFTEYMPGHPDERFVDAPRAVEICEIADMVTIALKLTQAGVGDYWDDVDRWVRNMYAEGQITDTDFAERIPEEFMWPPPPMPYVDDRDITRRSLGAFWGWMQPNNGLSIRIKEGKRRLLPWSIQHCCTANGSRTLYYVWDSIVTRSGGATQVNLLLNRASPWLDVESYLPVEGRVVLRSKIAQRVTVRLPEWVEPSKVTVSIEGKEKSARCRGHELALGQLKAGEAVTVNFPVPERTFWRLISNFPYKLTLRGSNVVAIEPRGEAAPLYEHQPTSRLVRKTRFVPKKRVVW